MGPTGTGKSTFISIVTGIEAGVGHSLNSCTSTINNVKLSFPAYSECDIVFVDTPGFDDTNKSDVEILNMIADWLQKRYRQEILLSGLVYFHRISDNRMAGTPLKNLDMFKKLCGDNAFGNVILATSMWDEVDIETGIARERELAEKYWAGMLKCGTTMGRFTGTRESAFSLLAPLIDTANERQRVLLQEEMVDMHKMLRATSAGQSLFSKMESLVRHRQEVLVKIRDEMRRASGDSATIMALMAEYMQLKVKLDTALSDMEAMKLPVGQRLLRSITRIFEGHTARAG
ncbi:P-loop containing nucleoside triphosphate hydrolase protein [Crassisporium funariophilum]|nr:P-loop containing nucleoside triphosphate hydrolase protein [Crassisporium funariophilum]